MCLGYAVRGCYVVIIPDYLYLHIYSVFAFPIEINHLVACIIADFCCHMLSRSILTNEEVEMCLICVTVVFKINPVLWQISEALQLLSSTCGLSLALDL